MTHKRRAILAISTVVTAVALAGCGSSPFAARQSVRAALQQPVTPSKDAAQSALKAETALAAGKMSEAAQFAEAAVMTDPGNGDYRTLLARVYMQDGRFSAAAAAYADAAELVEFRSDSVISYALAKIAEGDRVGAVAWLTDMADGLPASDLGLALALAGDYDGALYVLGEASRRNDATAQTRQNLSLALALAGRWAQASLVASQDLPMHRVKKRMLEFSSLASQPSKASQIASLMGVKLRGNAPMPAQLALANFPALPVMAANDDTAGPVVADVGAMVAELAAETQDVPVLVAADASAAKDGIAPAVVFAAFDAPVAANRAAAVVQQGADQAELSMEALAAVFEQEQGQAAAAVAPSRQTWSVQVASLDSADNAKLAWYDVTAHHPAAALYAASTHVARVGVRSYYRLTLDGLATRRDAQRLCNQLQAAKQDCFVRQNGGSQPLWTVRAQTMQLAMR
jgi:D-alanyl-D-alanine carboxypeptidase